MYALSVAVCTSDSLPTTFFSRHGNTRWSIYMSHLLW